jgi:hypothetical protein
MKVMSLINADICSVEAGSRTDFSITKLKEIARDDPTNRSVPCKNYGYEEYLKCLQEEIK